VTLLESDPKHGGVARHEVRDQLRDADGEYAGWGHIAQVQEWGYVMPCADVLYAALFDGAPVIEWNRISHFLSVTMRQIAEALLPEAQRGQTCMQGELSQQPMPLLPPPRHGKRFHIFCSTHNAGAAALVAEVKTATGLDIRMSEDEADLPSCERILIYLTKATWSRGPGTDAFCAQVEKAMELGTKRQLLAHEMPGADDGEARGAVIFDNFFAGEGSGGTPERLLRRNVYEQVAVALKSDEHRAVSMVLMAQELVKDVDKDADHREPQPIALVAEPPVLKWPRQRARRFLPTRQRDAEMALTSIIASSTSGNSVELLNELDDEPDIPHPIQRRRSSSSHRYGELISARDGEEL
jgi:hypothetical protein